MEALPEPLRPSSFEALLVEVGAWLRSPHRAKRATLVETYLAEGDFEHTDRLFAQAQKDHDEGRTAEAWPYLAEAYGIKQRLGGFVNGVALEKLEAKRREEDGEDGGDKKSTNDLEKTEVVIDRLALLPAAPDWSSDDKFKAVLETEGKAAGIQMTPRSLKQLFMHPRIQRIRNAATEKGR